MRDWIRKNLWYRPRDLKNEEDIQRFFAHYLLIVAILLNILHSISYLVEGRYEPILPLVVKGIFALALFFYLKRTRYPQWIIRIILLINIWGIAHNAFLFRSFESTPVVALLFLVLVPALTFHFKEALGWAALIWINYVTYFIFSYYSLLGFTRFLPSKHYEMYCYLLLTFSIFLFTGLRIIYGHLARTIFEVTKLRADKSLLFRTLIHDISSPLQLIAYSSKENERAQKALSQIKGMINTVRSLEQNELQKEKILQEKFCWYNQLVKIFDLYSSSFSQKSIEVVDRIPAKLRTLEILGNENLFFTQILGNIFSNAIKFSPENSRIYVEAELIRNDQVRLIVRDSGAGIPREKISDLFSFSSNFSTMGTAGEVGTGLGIPIMKGICNIHDIDLYIDSKVMTEKSTDHGTAFWLTMKNVN